MNQQRGLANKAALTPPPQHLPHEARPRTEHYRRLVSGETPTYVPIIRRSVSWDRRKRHGGSTLPPRRTIHVFTDIQRMRSTIAHPWNLPRPPTPIPFPPHTLRKPPRWISLRTRWYFMPLSHAWKKKGHTSENDHKHAPARTKDTDKDTATHPLQAREEECARIPRPRVLVLIIPHIAMKEPTTHHLSPHERGSLRVLLMLRGLGGDHDRAVGELLPRAADDEVPGPGRPDGPVTSPPHRRVVVWSLHQLVTVEHAVVLADPGRKKKKKRQRAGHHERRRQPTRETRVSRHRGTRSQHHMGIMRAQTAGSSWPEGGVR